MLEKMATILKEYDYDYELSKFKSDFQGKKSYVPRINIENIINVNEFKLPWKNLLIMKNEYWRKREEERDYNRIERIIMNMKFFRKYNLMLRLFLLKWGKFEYYKPG